MVVHALPPDAGLAVYRDIQQLGHAIATGLPARPVHLPPAIGITAARELRPVIQYGRLHPELDGIVGRPDACQFDPASLQCTGAPDDTCLTAEEIGEFAFYAVYLGRRHLSAKVRVFIDYLVETLAG